MQALPNCPACRTQNAGIYLAHVTEDAADSYFRYYRCPCGHVWGVHKDKPLVINHVTPLPSKPEASHVEQAGPVTTHHEGYWGLPGYRAGFRRRMMAAKAMMAPVQDCPACRKSEAFYLVRASTDSFFWYYGCLSCGHVWGVYKNHPQVLFHVTPLPSKPDASPVK